MVMLALLVSGIAKGGNVPDLAVLAAVFIASILRMIQLRARRERAAAAVVTVESAGVARDTQRTARAYPR
jgi:hypothetical protein